MANTQGISSGVQALIDQLKNQGIVEGQKQAKELIDEAHRKASLIVSQAQKEAERLLLEAHQKLQAEQQSFNEAIKIAFRDSEIALRAKLKEAFSVHLKRLVSLELQEKDFMKQLVLAIAGTQSPAIEGQARIEVLLPAEMLGREEKTFHMHPEGKENWHHLVLGITHEMLREGVELMPSAEIKGGIKVRLIGKDMEIDLTDEALSNLILKYLLPRYRDILLGQGPA